MIIKPLIYFLLGSLLSLILTYIIIIKKFNRFINDEIEQNNAYRKNAEADYYNFIESDDDFTTLTETEDS